MAQLPDMRRIFSALNVVVEPLARSAWTGPHLVGGGITVLESTGRRSGLRRERPLLTWRVGDLMLVGTVRRSSDWIANVRSQPSVHVWVDGERTAAVAHTVPLPIGWATVLRTDHPG